MPFLRPLFCLLIPAALVAACSSASNDASDPPFECCVLQKFCDRCATVGAGSDCDGHPGAPSVAKSHDQAACASTLSDFDKNQYGEDEWCGAAPHSYYLSNAKSDCAKH